MSAWVEKLSEQTDEILDTAWDVRDGTVIPSTETVALKDGAVKVDAVFLYADLAGSSQLAQSCPWETTAKIIRAYLACSTRLIKAYGGEVRSFDGDRVMGVFMGDMRNTYATECAREIFHLTEKIIGPKALAKFTSVKNKVIKLKNCIGVASGSAVAVRAGIRNSNDLIWIGKPPSLAAKLSDIREYPYCVYISKSVYSKIADRTKIIDGVNIWESRIMKFAGEEETAYRTKMMKTP